MRAMPTPASRSAPTVLALGGAAVAMLGLSACGKSTIKTGEVEKTIASQFAAQGVQLHDVSCKGDVKAEVGAPLSCTALNPSETKLILEGKVTAIKDDKGSFQVKAVRGIAKGSAVEGQALAIVKKRVKDARELSCPAEVPIPTTPTITCGLTRGSGKVYDAKIQIDDRSQMKAEISTTPR
jgi:hypothetical protein